MCTHFPYPLATILWHNFCARPRAAPPVSRLVSSGTANRRGRTFHFPLSAASFAESRPGLWQYLHEILLRAANSGSSFHDFATRA